MLDANMLDGVTLAYIGDSVVELYVRTKLVECGICGSRDLNAAAQTIVNAAAQAEAFRRIEDMLTEDETEIFKRGRNSGHLSFPKHAKMSDYRAATGFEAIFGYLSLNKQSERIVQLLDAAIIIPNSIGGKNA